MPKSVRGGPSLKNSGAFRNRYGNKKSHNISCITDAITKPYNIFLDVFVYWPLYVAYIFPSSLGSVPVATVLRMQFPSDDVSHFKLAG